MRLLDLLRFYLEENLVSSALVRVDVGRVHFLESPIMSFSVVEDVVRIHVGLDHFLCVRVVPDNVIAFGAYSYCDTVEERAKRGPPGSCGASPCVDWVPIGDVSDPCILDEFLGVCQRFVDLKFDWRFGVL